MPPLDDELRAALSSRASALGGPADPMPGIARRARALRRRRTAAALGGGVLSVLLVVGGVSLLGPGSPVGEPGPVATAPPTLEPSPTQEPSPTPAPPDDPFALDPQDPWPLRGDTALLADGVGLQPWQDQWSAAHPGSELVPLYVELYPPSQTVELFFLGRGGSEDPRWGVMRSSESGPETVLDVPLAQGTRSLAAALPGDEGVARLVVVAAPRIGGVMYAPDGETYQDMSETLSGDPGVAITALEGDPARDRYQVLDGDGDLDDPVDRRPAPDPEGEPDAAPANVLDWPVRGAVPDADVLAAARELLAANRSGARAQDVESKVLFAGADDGGNRFLLGQFWLPGDPVADTLGVVLAGGQGQDELQQLARLDDDTQVAVLRVGPTRAMLRATLVVVPRPGTGQVLYAETEDSPLRPVGAGQDHLDGPVLLDRGEAADEGRATDRLQVLDGDGREIFTGDVAGLLCGLKGCG